uniref:Uncharacterized protein n=1 Tax=Arundo donax TaxID=35708 RepID=A0A0A9B2B0_ARUDO
MVMCYFEELHRKDYGRLCFIVVLWKWLVAL